MGRPLVLFLGGIEGGVGEVDVLLVHLLLGQAHRLADTINMKWIKKEPSTPFTMIL